MVYVLYLLVIQYDLKNIDVFKILNGWFVYVFDFLYRGDSFWLKYDGDEGVGS